MTSASPRPRVLLVDGDVQARLIFEVTLKASGFEVLVASQGEEALSLLTRETVDVVVADTELAELDGFQLCSSLRARPEAARLLILLLSADRTQRNRARLAGSGADDFLLKPAYAHELDQRLRALLRRRQRERLIAGQDDGQPLGGSLTEVAVVDLLSLIELSGRSGLLTVRGPSGSRGELYFRQGRVVDAEVGHLSGPEGVYRLLGWSTGSFVLEWKNIRRRDAVAMSNADILVEGLRRLDEWNRLLQGLAGTHAVYEVDYRRLADHLAEIPDEVNALLRLFDGVRNLAQVIEDSGFPDLDALRVIRRLVESRILLESHPTDSSAGAALANPVFEGWQPEVSAPLSEVPVIPETDHAASDAAEEAPAAGLPAPAESPPATATSPGIGPREAAAKGESAAHPRSTALGIPTVEPPLPPAPAAEEPDGGADSPQPSAPFSLDLEQPEASVPEALASASAAHAAPAEAPSEEPPLTRRQQTQIFSRKEAMDELGLGRRRGRWALVFLAAAAVLAAGIWYRNGQTREPIATNHSPDGATTGEAVTRSEGAARVEREPEGEARPDGAAPIAAAPRKAGETALPGDSKVERSPTTTPSSGAILPPVELPAPPIRPPNPSLAENGVRGGEPFPSEAKPKSPEKPAIPVESSRPPSAEGRPPVALKPQTARPAAPEKPVAEKARAPAETASPAPTLATAGETPAEFKGDPVKVLSDCKSAFAAGRFRQALSSCADATKGNPTSAAAFAMLAHAQLNRDKPNEALAAAEKAIALDPNQADAYVIVGGVEQDRGHTAAAKAAYLKYLQLAPRGRYASDLRAIVNTL